VHYGLDHLFICTSPGAPEAALLIAFGLTEGPRNTHPGQGTANRCFFFQNAMLELLWVENEEEAKSALTQPTRLWERWVGRGRSSSPFGVCFKPTGEIDTPPFPVWKYRPKYLPEPLSIDIATNKDILTEPMLFFLAFARNREGSKVVKAEHKKHAIGFSEITRVEIILSDGSEMSPELKAVVEAGLIHVRFGEESLLTIGFDAEQALKVQDFRPTLPLVFRW
jgi:hypothetical protein